MFAWFKSKFVSEKQADVVTEQDLKKTGFDPVQVVTEKISEEPFCDFNKDLAGFVEMTPNEINRLLDQWKFFSTQQEHRHELAFQSGGKKCGDQMQIAKVRGIGREMIMEIGRKLITGDLNLTKVSFPIKAMVPRTALQTATFSSCTFPIYMALACRQTDPLEKFKYALTGIISPNYYMNMFLKPFNPVIGETLQGEYSDGTKIYCEQVSHHPPVTYFLIIGPNEDYRYYGYYDFEAKAGLNSGMLMNKGKRWIQFKSGERYVISFLNVKYEGVFMGTLRQSTIGTLEIYDSKNKLHFVSQFGNVDNKPADFFRGMIKRNEKPVAGTFGTYLGFINIEGKRFWDGRFVKPFRFVAEQNPIESDSSKRKDLQSLAKGDLDKAKSHRDQLENTQRNDAKLRRQHHHHNHSKH